MRHREEKENCKKTKQIKMKHVMRNFNMSKSQHEIRQPTDVVANKLKKHVAVTSLQKAVNHCQRRVGHSFVLFGKSIND